MRAYTGAISKDLITKYKRAKQEMPENEEEEILQYLWGQWLYLNTPHIINSNDSDKKERLHHVLDTDKEMGHNSIFELYEGILYIETGITSFDGEAYNKAMKIFTNEASKNGLDFDKYTILAKNAMKKMELYD